MVGLLEAIIQFEIGGLIFYFIGCYRQQTRGFVDDDDRGIFVDNLKRTSFFKRDFFSIVSGPRRRKKGMIKLSDDFPFTRIFFRVRNSLIRVRECALRFFRRKGSKSS